MTGRLRELEWPRFLDAPDGKLAERLYAPGLLRAVHYDRCCAYFSSSVLAAAANGFGGFISRIQSSEIASRPAIRLLVNEELSEADVNALIDSGHDKPLIEQLLARFGTPQNALQKDRLGMLASLVRERWLEVKVGVMRFGGGILHAKFGIFADSSGDALIFAGSGNESARGLRGNYEQLEISGSWHDAERAAHFREKFERLWDGHDPAVAVVPLPEAVRENLIRLAPDDAPAPTTDAQDDLRRQRALMLWQYALAAPYMVNGGAATCDAMAPVSLWAHQRKVVREVSAAWPEGRLLCDEVGMGKTIEAVLALRRLLAGRGARRVLFLAPANLRQQWQTELREKGGLRVPYLEGRRTLVHPDGRRQSVTTLAEAVAQDLLLLSRETARLEDNLPVLLEAQPWDLVILDEAHAARRAEQVESEFNSGTLLLDLLRRLQATGQTRSLMVLSATPMQTHPWEPWDLLQVLGEGGVWLSSFALVRRFYAGIAALARGALSDSDAVNLSAMLNALPSRPPTPPGLVLPNPEDAGAFAERLRFLTGAERESALQWLRSCSPLAQRMHRNTRATLREYYKQGLLPYPPPSRKVVEATFDFTTAEERSVYDEVARYIDRRFDELEHQKPGKGFVMTIYRRRAASSPFALQRSLERRREGLRAVIAQRAYDPGAELEDEAELQDLLNVQLTSALPENPVEAQAELRQVEDLHERVLNLSGLDSKRDLAVDWVRRLCADGRAALIFTGYADTMLYLRDALAGAFGQMVGSYSGDGGALRAVNDWETVTKDDVTAALTKGRIKILVCTDAASEGLNLQSAGALVNYDMPWNPSKVEQRIGRIDRIGQVLPVLPVVNLYLRDSIDARVYRALHERCGLFEHFVGPMQPVLSRAMRMLMERVQFNEAELKRLADEIEADPTVTELYTEDEAQEGSEPPSLLPPDFALRLIEALAGSGIELESDGDGLHFLGRDKLPIVLRGSDLPKRAGARMIDGLDPDLRRLLSQLRQPGERLPLVVARAEQGPFCTMACGWVCNGGVQEIGSFAELQRLVSAWNGDEPSGEAWISAEKELTVRARAAVDSAADRPRRVRQQVVEAQREAARLRLLDELGRMLICFEPKSSNLNQVLFRLSKERTPTADRLKRAFDRLGNYPTWDDVRMAELRDFESELSDNQRKARLTGRELDAALADPRWQVN